MTGQKERTKCVIYSRVTGYLSPVSEWNKGKKAEFRDRRSFDGVGMSSRDIPAPDGRHQPKDMSIRVVHQFDGRCTCEIRFGDRCYRPLGLVIPGAPQVPASTVVDLVRSHLREEAKVDDVAGEFIPIFEAVLQETRGILYGDMGRPEFHYCASERVKGVLDSMGSDDGQKDFRERVVFFSSGEVFLQLGRWGGCFMPQEHSRIPYVLLEWAKTRESQGTWDNQFPRFDMRAFSFVPSDEAILSGAIRIYDFDWEDPGIILDGLHDAPKEIFMAFRDLHRQELACGQQVSLVEQELALPAEEEPGPKSQPAAFIF